MNLKITVLGSGTSSGVPTIGCSCAVCRSTDPRDNRLRPSILIQYGGRNIVIDTTPDFRAQVLRARLQRLDAIVYTHGHADHIMGLDDVRPFNYHQGGRIPIYAARPTFAIIERVFAYVFNNTEERKAVPQARCEPDRRIAFRRSRPALRADPADPRAGHDFRFPLWECGLSDGSQRDPGCIARTAARPRCFVSRRSPPQAASDAFDAGRLHGDRAKAAGRSERISRICATMCLTPRPKRRCRRESFSHTTASRSMWSRPACRLYDDLSFAGRSSGVIRALGCHHR